MESQRPEPTLTEVQTRVRADHARIRSSLDEIARRARGGAAEGDAPSLKRLTDALWALFLLLDDHLAMEERDLVPMLERTQVWGKLRIARLHEEHRQQRAVLLAMVDECDGKTKRPSAIVDDARWLVESLRRDMDREEEEFESIRDDGFMGDQCTG